MTPTLASSSRKVVATEALSSTASTATLRGALFIERNAEFFKHGAHFRIDFVQAAQFFLRFGHGVIDIVLIIDGRIMDVGPMRLLHGLPMAVGLDAPVQHEIRLALDLEMRRTTSSLNPGGKASVSISLTNPYLYSDLTKLSIVSVVASISDKFSPLQA
jgi:hypothetical protein